MKPALRLLPVLAAAALTACAGALNFDAPPARNTVGGSERMPSQQPMQLTPESYRVARGDTLFSIAFRNNLDYRDIARWNGIGPDYRIAVGQVLQLTPQADVPTQPTVRATIQPETRKIVIAQPALPAPPKPAAAPPLKAAVTPIAAAPAEYPATATASYQWQWPTQGRILHPYSPAQGVKGIDFTGDLGQPVFAAAPGRVVYSGNALKGYGELIIIKHDDTHLSAYGYNRKRYVEEGDVVTMGQPIGELGMGPESKPILHFEIRERGTPVNPAPYLPARPASG